MATHTAFIALGSNLDDPAAQVKSAMTALDSLPLTRVLECSSLYRSAPVGYRDQPDFINAVVRVETGLAPHALLDAMLAVERLRGRTREFANAPRTLDLDLLLFDDRVLHEHGLTLPHPRMHRRAFVLQPLLEIAPECVIPGVGAAAEAAKACEAQQLEKLMAPENGACVVGASAPYPQGGREPLRGNHGLPLAGAESTGKSA